MVEHWSRKPGVVGSIPIGGIYFWSLFWPFQLNLAYITFQVVAGIKFYAAYVKSRQTRKTFYRTRRTHVPRGAAARGLPDDDVRTAYHDANRRFRVRVCRRDGRKVFVETQN